MGALPASSTIAAGEQLSWILPPDAALLGASGWAHAEHQVDAVGKAAWVENNLHYVSQISAHLTQLSLRLVR